MKKVFVFLVILMFLVTTCTVVAFADGPAAIASATETYKAQLFKLAFEVVATIVTALAGYVGICIKQLYKRYVDTDEKHNVAKTCVNFVEQVYRDIHGQDKLDMAIKYATIILGEKGVPITETELYTLLEAAVKEMNDKFAENE